MQVPTIEASTDARFGFDGGRHARILEQAHKANIDEQDWLLIDCLFKQYRMRVTVPSSNGPLSLLGPVKPQGGGMVQGLQPSTSLYTLLPRELLERLGEAFPHVAMWVEPRLLEVFHSSCDRDLSVAAGLSMGRVCSLAPVLEKGLD